MYKSLPHVKEVENAPLPQPLLGSLLAFSINGESQGIAYRYPPASKDPLSWRLMHSPKFEVNKSS